VDGLQGIDPNAKMAAMGNENAEEDEAQVPIRPVQCQAGRAHGSVDLTAGSVDLTAVGVPLVCC
jgi:hypothetical protein